MIRITWRQYWDELRSAWIIDFRRDLLRQAKMNVSIKKGVTND